MPYLVALVVVIAVIALLFQYWYVTLPVVLVIAGTYGLIRLVRHIRKERYFASDEFREHKARLAAVVAEHNDIVKYVSDLRQRDAFRIGASSTGTQAHLATFENTSHYNYRRDRNVANYASTSVHNCSLQVVRNASAAPIKYLTKYFDIKATEPTLCDVEQLGESISRLEDAVANLKRRETAITGSFSPPAFILKHYSDEFMSQVGVTLSPVSVPYPTYTFQYVSAGGNSSQQSTIRLDSPTIDALIGSLSEKIRFSKSAAGQRALMTAKLREFIKRRDNFTCKNCSVSVVREPNLLLEVDHILPVSRGGLSTIENLQTLCWRCNRTKSNKVPTR